MNHETAGPGNHDCRVIQWRPSAFSAQFFDHLNCICERQTGLPMDENRNRAWLRSRAGTLDTTKMLNPRTSARRRAWSFVGRDFERSTGTKPARARHLPGLELIDSERRGAGAASPPGRSSDMGHEVRACLCRPMDTQRAASRRQRLFANARLPPAGFGAAWHQ